ncbi:hypothetical protein PM082_022687 [Marasmius tenuissimus]|nr:hypothetical protein PM082_007156 [Marasmius tenuissimus]KAJ8096069.1 hypothetical protein PM082_022687 [Marasmius tenuissimus]
MLNHDWWSGRKPLWDHSDFIFLEDRYIPSALKTKYPPLVPSLTNNISSSYLASSDPEPPEFVVNSASHHLSSHERSSTSLSLPILPLFSSKTVRRIPPLLPTVAIDLKYLMTTEDNRQLRRNTATTESSRMVGLSRVIPSLSRRARDMSTSGTLPRRRPQCCGILAILRVTLGRCGGTGRF